MSRAFFLSSNPSLEGSTALASSKGIVPYGIGSTAPEFCAGQTHVKSLLRFLSHVGFVLWVGQEKPVEGDVNDKELLRRVMRGVRAVICPSKVKAQTLPRRRRMLSG